ncbi:histamine N-methyltransferase-like [Lytechinus pictus]|uniref:histamine N-methyltransferase-like n=1 Tax=Lytechinus pictus TaxID=7653 RepID=UPI0030B9DC89
MMAENCVPDSCFENLPKLVDDLDDYLKAYQAYAEFSGLKVDIYKDWARIVFEEQVVTHFISKFPCNGTLRVLAVGSGDGKVDSCMLEQLVARYPRIHYTVVEPANEPLEEFKSLIDESRPKFDGVEFEWHNETFDEFQKLEEEKAKSTGADKERFHLIHAIHSLYYANDLQQAHTYLRDRLVKQGALLVILLSEEAGIYRVWDRHPKLCEGSPATNLCSAHLRQIYAQSDTPYTFHHQSWPSDISQCFDAASVQGGRMLDFITHVRNFRQSAPKELKKDVIAFLRRLNQSDKEDETSSGGYQRDWDSMVMIKS